MTLINKSFEFNDCKINVYGTQDKPLFMAKEIGDLLGLVCIRKNLMSIPDEWKTTINIKENNTVTESNSIISAGNPNKTFITEQAMYKLVFRSNKPFADEFTNKVCEILKEIRKTGKFELRPSSITKRLTFRIENEHDLQCRIVNFIRTYYPDALFNSNQGELQDTVEKRIDAKYMGYLAGSPDLEIKESSKGFIGMVIECKSPTGYGKLSEVQTEVHQKLKERGYRVIVSNDYEYVLLEIKKYLDNIRYLCEYCKKRVQLFRSLHTRKIHYRCFHKHDVD